MTARIHPTAIVEPGVELGADVSIGPLCHVHAGARIGAGTELRSHVVVLGTCTLGAANVVHPFAVLGGEAQVRQHANDPSDGHGPRESGEHLVLGDRNVVRESVTINAASGAGATRIGSDNLFMAGAHVAHDVVMGSSCVIANAVQLAGHVVVGDGVTFGGLAGVAQHLHVGDGAFVAAGAMCERDVPPFVIVQGDRARVRAPNVVGLERRGVPPASIALLRRAVATLWMGDVPWQEALAALDRRDPWVSALATWLEDPARRRRLPRRPVRSSG